MIFLKLYFASALKFSLILTVISRSYSRNCGQIKKLISYEFDTVDEKNRILKSHATVPLKDFSYLKLYVPTVPTYSISIA